MLRPFIAKMSILGYFPLRSDFVTRVGNKFAALQILETEDTASLRYSHFETACKESAIEAIPLKPKLKKHIENR